MKRLLSLLLICILLAGVSCSAAAAESDGSFTDNQGTIDLTYDQTVQALRDAGIAIPEEKVTETKAWIEKNNLNRAFFASYLLSRVGWGVYDYDTYTWTPTSSDVYAFDCEIFNISKMYTDFLQGVASIVPGFAYSDVEETLGETEDNEEEPDVSDTQAYLKLLMGLLSSRGGPRSEGTKTVSFQLNGHTYQKELAYYGDWFNEDAVDWINQVLEAEGFSGHLYSFDDAGQGLILIYGGPEKAEAVRRALNQSIREIGRME